MSITETGQLPSVGGGDDDGDKERDVEEEKLRQEAIKKAEEERRVKHRKMEEEREHLRQNIRDKVGRTAQLGEGGGGLIAQRIAFSLCTQRPRV